VSCLSYSLLFFFSKSDPWMNCFYAFFVLSYRSLRRCTLPCLPPAAQFVTSSRANVFALTEPSCTAEKISSAQPHLRQLSKCNDFSRNVVCPVTVMLTSVLPAHSTSKLPPPPPLALWVSAQTQYLQLGFPNCYGRMFLTLLLLVFFLIFNTILSVWNSEFSNTSNQLTISVR
jgi:hypothetical protein